MFVDGVGDPFLASAGFTNDQHGADVARHSLHHGHEFMHELAGHNKLGFMRRIVETGERGHSVLTRGERVEPAGEAHSTPLSHYRYRAKNAIGKLWQPASGPITLVTQNSAGWASTWLTGDSLSQSDFAAV